MHGKYSVIKNYNVVKNLTSRAIKVRVIIFFHKTHLFCMALINILLTIFIFLKWAGCAMC